jgi:hypothetical protein
MADWRRIDAVNLRCARTSREALCAYSGWPPRRGPCRTTASRWRVRLPWPAAPEVHYANQSEYEGAEHVPRGEAHRSRHAREGEEEPRPLRRRSSPRQDAEPDEPQGKGVRAG